MLAFSCSAPSVTVSSAAATIRSDLIFVKAVMIPEAFMNFAWSVVSLFIAVTTIKAVAMTIILAAIAFPALFYHLKHEIHFEIKYTKSGDDFIEMIDISDINKSDKRLSAPAPDNEPPNPITLPFCAVRKFSYADAVGYDHMEVTKPRNSEFSGYDFPIAELFEVEEQEPTASVVSKIASTVLKDEFIQITQIADIKSEPVRRLSYADAVGYDSIETRRPKNPDAVGYDVYLGDLFPDEAQIISANSQSTIKKMSYADAVGYDKMEIKRPRYSHTIESIGYLGNLFAEELIERKTDYKLEFDINYLLLKIIEALQNRLFRATIKASKMILLNSHYIYNHNHKYHFESKHYFYNRIEKIYK